MRNYIIGMLALLCALALRAEDSYIYWLQDTAKYNGTEFSDTDYRAKVVAISGTGAEWAYGSGTYLNIYMSGEGSGPAGTGADYTYLNFSSANDNTPRYAGLTSDLTGSYTYFVELYNDSGIFAHSEGVSYSEDFVYKTNMGVDLPKQSISMVNFVSASAPEPTSGLMLLIGSALLALRRKRV